jgi:hypothetical protein
VRHPDGLALQGLLRRFPDDDDDDACWAHFELYCGALGPVWRNCGRIANPRPRGPPHPGYGTACAGKFKVAQATALSGGVPGAADVCRTLNRRDEQAIPPSFDLPQLDDFQPGAENVGRASPRDRRDTPASTRSNLSVRFGIRPALLAVFGDDG